LLKRARLPRSSAYSRHFSKDWDRLNSSGRFSLRELKGVMLLLIANDEPLPKHWKDHPLKGDWRSHRECHIGGDFLLIYRCDDDSVWFDRAGRHSELFG
jgi:mRNA interferase YafQ